MPRAVSYRTRSWGPRMSWGAVVLVGFSGSTSIWAEEAVADAPAATATETQTAESAKSQAADTPKHMLPEVKGAKRLDPKSEVWVDKERGVVIVDGAVSLRRGLLEMFACPRRTKEHESVVAVNAKAFLVHVGLISVGAEVGKPVQFEPEYAPPSGTEIEITVIWPDETGKLQKARAQDWIRDLKTKQAMTLPFVFAGSGFYKDEQTGQQYYLAEQGDFICVSNFATATLDVPAESTQANEGLMFEAFTENIPALGTPVRLELKPKLEE
jgi:hypothetical protein